MADRSKEMLSATTDPVKSVNKYNEKWRPLRYVAAVWAGPLDVMPAIRSIFNKR